MSTPPFAELLVQLHHQQTCQCQAQKLQPLQQQIFLFKVNPPGIEVNTSDSSAASPLTCQVSPAGIARRFAVSWFTFSVPVYIRHRWPAAKI